MKSMRVIAPSGVLSSASTRWVAVQQAFDLTAMLYPVEWWKAR